MKAVTIPQPQATLAARGVVTILARDEPAPDGVVGERIAIHAGDERDEGLWERLSGKTPTANYLPGGVFHFGGFPLRKNSVVGSARLAACLPIVGPGNSEPWPHLFTSGPGVLKLWERNGTRGRAVADQLPFGRFEPGRWAWMLEDAAPCEDRCPWCNGAGVPSDWGNRDGTGPRNCPVCFRDGRCDPIEKTGRPGIWEWTP